MANPTTNYGFVLPTSSDLVTDLPADFDVALQGVDTQLKALNPETTLGDISYRSSTANTKTRLAIGTTGQVLTVASGVPAWQTPTAGMTNPMTTTGDTIYSSSGSTPARLPIGTTGQVLTVAGGVPTWAAASPGKVIQVLTTSYNAAVGSSAGGWIDTGLSLSITPTSASSRILVLANINGIGNSSSSGTLYRMNRSGTIILADQFAYTASTAGFNIQNAGCAYTDSPATTSSINYKVQMLYLSSGTMYAQYGSTTSTMTLLEIGA